MKHSIIILFSVFFFGNLSAQELQGKILHAETGRPVAGAELQVSGTEEQLLSSPQGIFVVEVEDFPVQIRISAPGYEPREVKFIQPTAQAVVYLSPVAEALAEVVLRSTIIPQELMETPASVGLVTEEDLEHYDEMNIVAALDVVPGVYVHQGAPNTNKISIRGIGARSQYSTNRVKAYFMEIPISTAEGETALNDIDQTVVERAEIIKGPVSSVYGAGLGGVINLYATDAEVQGLQAKTKATYASYNTLKNMAQVSYATEKIDLVGTYNRLSSDGYRENSSYHRNSFNFNGKIEAGGKNLVGLFAQFTKLKAYIPSALDIDSYINDPSSAAYTWAAARGYESYDKGMIGVSNRHIISEDWSNTSSIFLSFRDAYEPRPFNILNESHMATGARTKFLWEEEVFDFPSEISFGSEVYFGWYDASTFENLYVDFSPAGSIPGAILSFNSEERNYYNIFAQWNLELTSRLQVEAGLNFNSTRYDLTDHFHDDQIDQSGNYRFENIFSPRLGAVYALSEGKNLYASISHGFSVPTLAQTLTPEGLINTELEPETGINYEVGFKGNFLSNKLYTELTAYSIQINNLLVAQRVGQDQYVGRNAGKTDHNGLELLLNYRFRILDGLSGSTYVNAAFNAFEFDRFVDGEEDFSGNALPAVPDQSVNAGLELSSDLGVTLFAGYQHEGQMPLNDQNSVYTRAYDLFHLKASYEPELFQDWGIEFFAGINNVLDEHYAASIVPNAVAFGGGSPRYYYPGNPRNYFAGISLEHLF